LAININPISRKTLKKAACKVQMSSGFSQKKEGAFRFGYAKSSTVFKIFGFIGLTEWITKKVVVGIGQSVFASFGVVFVRSSFISRISVCL